MATIDAKTGKPLSGIEEVWQSIACIFGTPVGTRIMRRLFGANRLDFVDRGLSPMNLIDFYAEIANALKAEPRFVVANVSLDPTSDVVNGQAIFNLAGVYYPRGQLGDFSVAETVKGSIVWSDPSLQSLAP